MIQAPLSIFNFDGKQFMKNVMKRAIATVLFYLFIYCGKLWRYLLTDDVDSYTRIMMHQLYTSEKI